MNRRVWLIGVLAALLCGLIGWLWARYGSEVFLNNVNALMCA
ncbi:MAG: hypothetical protein BWZ07_02702 [Alphaproteobacteria bacterium ADurb.BinA280]|jgi:hypothetical protein|nr:MAG: hypothetical protein BWZ07_02702 [Alphaproteobacteria bacterium ADurb.BinA280]